MDLPCTMPNIIGIERVAVDVTGDRLTDHAAEVRMALAHQ